MIEITTKGGKKIGILTDSEEKIIVKGKEINLSDAYGSDEIRDAFNKEVKDLKDESTK